MNVPEISVGHPDLREVVMIKTFFLLAMHIIIIMNLQYCVATTFSKLIKIGMAQSL